jgi:hypothetical protein
MISPDVGGKFLVNFHLVVCATRDWRPTAAFSPLILRG